MYNVLVLMLLIIPGRFMKHNLELICTNPSALPGFFGAAIPKRTARGREEDNLLMLLSQKSGEPLSADLVRKWLENSSAIFYKSSGSVTSAMRAVIFALNGRWAAKKNLLLPPEKPFSFRPSSLGVIPSQTTLFLASTPGLSQAVLAKPGARAFFFDPDLDPRGLGLTQVPRMRFFQQAVDEGDVILFSTQFPAAFLANSGGSAQPELKTLLDELESNQPLPAEVGLARVRAGEGAVLWAAAIPEPTAAQSVAEPPAQTEPLIPAAEAEADFAAHAQMEVSAQLEAAPEPELTGGAQTSAAAELPSEGAQSVPEAVPIETEAAAELQPSLLPEQPAASGRRAARYYSEQTPEKAPRDRAAEKAARKLRRQTAYRKVADGAGTMNKLGEGLAALLTGEKKRSVEEQTESAELSRGTKLLLAVLVPLLVVGILSAIYISQGQGSQYAYLMAQAQAAAENAAAMQGAAAQREAWQQVLSWLDQAETYRQSSELRALRVRAQDALDVLDGAVRLVYKPAYTSTMMTGLEISRIVSVGTDLSLLDKATGTVLHLSPSSGGYVPDLEFNCQPGLRDGVQVRELADVLAVPINNAARAPILALDANGNGLLCGVGKEPKAFALIPPDGGFGKIQAVLYDAGRLFVLDTIRNALWIYRGANLEYTNPPDSYFEEKPMTLRRRSGQR